MKKTSYYDSEDNAFQIKLKKGLTDAEIKKLEKSVPFKLNKELIELLQYTRGVATYCGFLDKINFDNLGTFHFKTLIPYSLTITGDGLGGNWIQEINQKGEWGKIYLVGHDPPVLIKQAENLTDFLIQVHDYLIEDEESFFTKIYNDITSDIYFGKGRLLEYQEAIKSTDKLLSQFASDYNEDWFIADLREAKNGEGFRLEAGYDETIRLGNELIWALKKHKYTSFWARLTEWFR